MESLFEHNHEISGEIRYGVDGAFWKQTAVNNPHIRPKTANKIYYTFSAVRHSLLSPSS